MRVLCCFQCLGESSGCKVVRSRPKRDVRPLRRRLSKFRVVKIGEDPWSRYGWRSMWTRPRDSPCAANTGRLWEMGCWGCRVGGGGSQRFDVGCRPIYNSSMCMREVVKRG
ncbi:hypothetical protein HBI56_086230 [Parastagonospora nodorum]|uniref:Uncharacterized protein n=1 Tax=Phaeosphaeria nodorum (strain SN15 / ATCC MYA-4574 / FGSC 10173) TaxID=321614 RepID=A0A7U2I834_PHANO|nr:hypothetical protein HBH56_113330 [Parastagonospora nodorum]QRD03573.1 hypothetical protein JI435_419840 [Parastagonospora nodorum SN15]KAH3921563.1 hypothetical protein HBH54_239100 [Parastagonospora nodorum]KAH3951042.1 hypothetical protein HBH53_069000 [Parastagonospora nodorum]KAH3962970.1 hypothetical protein HBH51_169670 [Parastagonospora nodorum]